MKLKRKQHQNRSTIRRKKLLKRLKKDLALFGIVPKA